MTILVISTLAIAPSAQSAGEINLVLRDMSLNEEPGHNSPPKVDEMRGYLLEFQVANGEAGTFQIAIETSQDGMTWEELTRDLDGDGNTDSFDTNTTTISGGHHTVIYFNLSLSEVGSINIRAFLDPDNEIDESDENNNNHKSVSFSVEPASGETDLHVAQMTTSVSRDGGDYQVSTKVQAGDTVRLDIEYGNSGDISSSSSYDNHMQFNLYLHDEDTTPSENEEFNNDNFESYIEPEFPSPSVVRDGVDYYYVEPTDADREILTEVLWETPSQGMDAGFYVFTFVLDENNTVDESDEENNQLSFEICFHPRSGPDSDFCELADLTAPTHSNPKPFTAATGPEEENGNYPGEKECGVNDVPCISGTTTYVLFKARNDGSWETHDLPDASVELSTRFCGEPDSEPAEVNCDEWGVVGEFQPFMDELDVATAQRDQPVGSYFVIAWEAPNIPGYWDLKLYLDSSDDIDEENEENNEFEFQKMNNHFLRFVERKADLQISSFDIGAEVAVQDYSVTLRIWVDQTNEGTLDAENVCVTLDIDGPTDATSGHLIITDPSGNPLLKNIGIDDEPLLFSYVWVPEKAGIYNITATVNPESNETYTHVVEWDDDDDPPNENNQLKLGPFAVMPIIPDLAIYPQISNFIPVMDVSPTTDNGFAMVGVDSIVNFTIINDGYRDLFANESFVLKIQDKYQADIEEIILSGPIAMGESILVQFPYVFEEEKRYEFHVSVDADNQISEIFEGICNWQTQGQEKNCQRFEVYAVTVIDTWISDLSIEEEDALLGNDHHLHFQVGMDFLANGSQHNVYFAAYANSALTGYKLIVDGGNYMSTLVCDCTTGVDSTGIPYVSLTGDGTDSVHVNVTVIWEPVGIAAGNYDISIELDTSWLQGLNSNLSNDIVCFANNPTLYRDDGGDCDDGSVFVNTFTTDLRIDDVYVQPGETGVNIVYVDVSYPSGEISHLGGVGCVATSTCIFVTVSIHISDYALGALSANATFVENLGLVMIMDGMTVGEPKTLEFEWIAVSGSYVIVATVDPTGLINEYNEYNNELLSSLVNIGTTTGGGDEEEGGLIPSPPLISVIVLLLVVSLVRRRV